MDIENDKCEVESKIDELVWKSNGNNYIHIFSGRDDWPEVTLETIGKVETNSKRIGYTIFEQRISTIPILKEGDRVDLEHNDKCVILEMNV